MTGGLDGLRRGWQLVRGRSCLQAARPVVVPCKNAPFNVVYSHKCVSLRGAKRRGNPSARLPARIPSVTAPPCHLPLHRGGLGGAALCPLWRGLAGRRPDWGLAGIAILPVYCSSKTMQPARHPVEGDEGMRKRFHLTGMSHFQGTWKWNYLGNSAIISVRTCQHNDPCAFSWVAPRLLLRRLFHRRRRQL